MSANPIVDIIAGIFKPLADVIDHLTVSGDQKVALQTAVLNAQIQSAQSAFSYQSQLLDAQSKIVLAETTGQSWLQRNWRPLSMVTFLVLVVLDAFAILPNKLAPQMWTLLQIGFGGYIVGRSGEKIATQYFAAQDKS